MAGETSLSRLFVGTFLSPDQQQLLGRLRDQGDKLTEDWGRRLRWVKQEKLHMTWVFLGSTDALHIPEISNRLSSLVSNYSAMAPSYDRVEFWPNARKPRQLVLTPSVVPRELKELAGEIRTQLAEFTEKPEDREFRPHLTLLRFDHHDKSARPANPDHRRLEFPDWFDTDAFLPLVHNIGKVSLIESHMGKKNDDYEVLKDVLLT